MYAARSSSAADVSSLVGGKGSSVSGGAEKTMPFSSESG